MGGLFTTIGSLTASKWDTTGLTPPLILTLILPLPLTLTQERLATAAREQRGGVRRVAGQVDEDAARRLEQRAVRVVEQQQQRLVHLVWVSRGGLGESEAERP